MATAQKTQKQDRQPIRWGRNLVLIILVIAIALTAWFWTRMRETAVTRSSVAAQTGCLCRYAAGRSLASCEADPAVKLPWVGLSEDAETKSLTASVAIIARQTARWTPDSGCVLEAWQD